jgi:hypothetical protein
MMKEPDPTCGIGFFGVSWWRTSSSVQVLRGLTAMPTRPLLARACHEPSPHRASPRTRRPVRGKKQLAGETAEDAEGLSRWQFSTTRIV